MTVAVKNGAGAACKTAGCVICIGAVGERKAGWIKAAQAAWGSSNVQNKSGPAGAL